jgi:hypothetical protein
VLALGVDRGALERYLRDEGPHPHVARQRLALLQQVIDAMLILRAASAS